MKNFAVILGLHLAFLSVPILHASEQEALKICACLADPASQNCAEILFDDSDERIDPQNLTVEARKKLSQFFQKTTAEESKQLEKELEDAHGLAGKLSFSACSHLYKSHDSQLDNLTALALYRSNAHWMSNHKEEAAIFFNREDVKEALQKTKTRYSDPKKEKAQRELLLEAERRRNAISQQIQNEREKVALKMLFVQGEIGFLKYQWEMLKRW